jgi:bromodomain-containing factor 1
MDVELERNGLPTAFGTSQDSETPLHEVTNMVASASNAQAAPLKPVVASDPSEPVTSFASVDSTEPTLSTSEVQITKNGVVSKPLNGDHVPLADSSDQPQFPDVSSTLRLLEPDSPVPLSTTTESITTVSAPEEALAPSGGVLPAGIEVNSISQEPISLHPISDFHTEPTPLPEPPISDLRSSTQTNIKDSIPQPILETKTESASAQQQPVLSNLPRETTQTSDIMSQTLPVAAGDPTPAPLEIAPETEVKLPSPPAQSLSPAPQPTEATLSQDHAMSDAPIVSPQEDAPLPAAPASLLAEEPRDPAPTPAVPAVPQNTEDQTMIDAPVPSQAKVAREREDDNEESEPLAKRAKTEINVESSFKIPEAPNATQTPPATNGDLATGEDDTITPSRLAHMKKIISNLKKSNTSTAFRAPVDPVALNIPSYPEIIKEPMDLGTMDAKLKAKQYTGVSEFVRDFNLVVNNCYTFNGRDHVVSQGAAKMEVSFNSQMNNMPPVTVVEPSKEEKKLQKPKVESVRQAPPRRQSNAGAGSARSPPASNNPQTFALGPEGVPLIRRDSNVNDGRAKRAVVPPKRHSDFAGRPKKKKYELELKFCWEVLKELQSPKNWTVAQYFYHPVDPVALNIPTYFQIIKKPMDLTTVQTKLENHAYEKASEFKEDVQLIFKNCFKFNSEGEYVNDCGHKTEEIFNKKWETKDDWIASRQPDSEPHSAAEEDDDEEEEDSEAEDDSEDDRNNKILLLQKQIEMMSKQMGELTQPKKKKKSTPPMPPKKTSKTKGDKKEKTVVPKAKKEEPQPKKKSKKVKEEKDRFVTYNEKQYISNGISQLPDKQMGEALKLIQQNVPHLKGVEETEIELDIDELPNKVLLKLLHFVQKSGGGPLPPAPVSETTYAAPAASGGKPKKNKPMGKSEQEAQIEELKSKLNNYADGGVSPGASKFKIILCD